MFENPCLIREVNQTFLMLIPKVPNPEFMRDFRPISLCNVIYKLITKIIVNRIKPVMSTIISPNQCSFVPGRLSSDNIIVAQEVIHTMKTMKGKKGFMAVKIDLEKAYDRINWKFAINCLREVEIPESLIFLILGVYLLPLCNYCGMVVSQMFLILPEVLDKVILCLRFYL